MSGVVKIDEKFCNQDIQELYVSEGYSGKSIEIKINFKKYGIQDIVKIMHESYLGFEYGGQLYDCVGFYKNPESDIVVFYLR